MQYFFEYQTPVLKTESACYPSAISLWLNGVKLQSVCDNMVINCDKLVEIRYLSTATESHIKQKFTWTTYIHISTRNSQMATLLLRYIGIQEYNQNTASWVKSPIAKRHVENEFAHWCRLNQTDCNVLAISCVYRLENNYFAKHSDLYGLATDCLLTGNLCKYIARLRLLHCTPLGN